STVPQRAMISATTWSMRALSLMSARQAAACPPSLTMASTVSRAPVSLRSTTATPPPARARPRGRRQRERDAAAEPAGATRHDRHLVRKSHAHLSSCLSGSLQNGGQLTPHPLAGGLGGLGPIANRPGLGPGA